MSTERVAIVTGGSCGVGREITRRLTLQGYAVVVAYHADQAAAEAVVDEILAANGIALAIRADVTDDVDVERLFVETVEALRRVDVVVHAVRRPPGRSDDAVRAVARAFSRVLHGRDVTVDTVAYGPEGAAAAVADAVANLAGRDGRCRDGRLIEVETRAGPGSSTGATAVRSARPSHRGNHAEVTMSSTDVTAKAPTPLPGTSEMWLEVVVVPVSDVERARAFYETTMGWRIDADRKGGGRWVVQFTPPGSLCSIWIGEGITSAAPGSSQGMILAVKDVGATRDALIARGVDVSEVFHRDDTGQVPGPDPEGRSYTTFASFSDPDGNSWVLQEIRTRLPGR